MLRICARYARGLCFLSTNTLRHFVFKVMFSSSVSLDAKVQNFRAKCKKKRKYFHLLSSQENLRIIQGEFTHNAFRIEIPKNCFVFYSEKIRKYLNLRKLKNQDVPLICSLNYDLLCFPICHADYIDSTLESGELQT